MTQTNTTQNKEELSKEVEERFEKQDFCFTDLDGNRKLHTNDDFTDEVKQFLAQELSQAHQSGIEEGRKTAAKEGKNWYFDGDELVITKGSWVIDRYKKHQPKE